MKVHVHVYKISEKYEVDIEAETSEEGMEKALSMAKEGKLQPVEPDTKYLALSFPETKPPKIDIDDWGG